MPRSGLKFTAQAPEKPVLHMVFGTNCWSSAFFFLAVNQVKLKNFFSKKVRLAPSLFSNSRYLTGNPRPEEGNHGPYGPGG